MTPTVSIVRRIIERDGPITLGDVAKFAGVTRRAVERAVQELRLAGEPIIDDAELGLRYTADPEELSDYVNARRDRARSILRASRPLRATVDRLRQRDLTLFGRDAA